MFLKVSSVISLTTLIVYTDIKPKNVCICFARMTLELLDQIINFALANEFVVKQIAEVTGFPLVVLEKNSSSSLPTVFVSSGSHGDEPASPLAMRELLKNRTFENQANWRICPILNPSGVNQGTRENAQGIDINRDFKHPRSTEVKAYINWLQNEPAPSMSLTLHEDWESEGFYLYQIIDRPSHRTYSQKILRSISKVGPIEQSKLIDGHTAENGLIEPYKSVNDIEKANQWSEAAYQFHRSPHLHYTFESPSNLAIELRIRMQVAAVREAINQFSKSQNLATA